MTLVAALVMGPASAAAKEPVLRPATYPDMSTFECRTDAITIHPGQNLNEFQPTTTCPNAIKVRGPADPAIFEPGSKRVGYITRFRPSMVEIKPSGKLVTPAVWDLHLHHVVWLTPAFGPTFAAGEEKTIAKMPQGYGLRATGGANWTINRMIHNLTSAGGRQVYLTWTIDWVPESNPPRTDIEPVEVTWLDVAGLPQIYPVFDAKRSYDLDGDGNWVFPDDVPTDPALPGYEERSKISPSRRWVVPNGGATLVFGAGHLHPGGRNVALQVARDGPDAGTTDGDDPSEIRQIFRSKARYYEPAGAVSWDVSMKATPRDWRVSLKGGDTVSINVTYRVKKASWYESMGIMPLSWTTADDPLAKDPFDDSAEVEAMYRQGGTLTHGRLRENIDKKAGANLKLPNPRKLAGKGRVPSDGLTIDGFLYSQGGYSATPFAAKSQMRPVLARQGSRVTFTNQDALSSMPQSEQVWHSITFCKPPCNRGSGIGYPLADGPLDSDSGQLGYGTGGSAPVTTGSNTWSTPPLRKAGKTFTYFCRIHPFMRGSIRVRRN